jgi:hypothetical protein
MVKPWDLAKKVEYFNQLSDNLRQEKSSIPSLKIFKGMIKDHKDRSSYTQYSAYGYNVNNSSSPVKKEEGETPELTLDDVLITLVNDQKLPQVILDNLKGYCTRVKSSFKASEHTTDRNKLFLISTKHSH